jgi:hypothetical protein
MKSIHLVAVLLISSPILSVQGNEAFLGNTGIESSAVDAEGVRHRSGDYVGRKSTPWLDDRVQAFAPDYPYADKRQHREGVGLFRLTLDVRTGVVTKVATLKPTGLRRWRSKPGKWKEIDMPVIFTTGWGSLPPASHMSALPSAGHR